MKVVTQAFSSKDLKLKAVAEVAPSDDEETYSGLAFKRRRKLLLSPLIILPQIAMRLPLKPKFLQPALLLLET